MYSARQNGDVVRDESEGYAVYSNGKVVALFGIYKVTDPGGAVTGGTTMSNVGLRGCSEHAERSWHLCASSSCDSSGALYVTPHSEEAVEVFDLALPLSGEPPGASLRT